MAYRTFQELLGGLARVVLGEELYGGDDNGVLGGLVGEETSKLLTFSARCSLFWRGPLRYTDLVVSGLSMRMGRTISGAVEVAWVWVCSLVDRVSGVGGFRVVLGKISPDFLDLFAEYLKAACPFLPISSQPPRLAFLYQVSFVCCI